MKARAKRDVKILMEDGRFSDFREGNEYRCLQRQDGSMVLMDEQKCGFSCTKEEFDNDFEITEND